MDYRITTRSAIIHALTNYRTSFDEEKKFRDAFLELLQHQDAFQRHHLPGHVTASAWIVDETMQFTLLTHHAKLNRWLQPGGHADGEENVLNVALREAEEETGLKSLVLMEDNIFDIDIHRIPARKDSPEHLHYDIRFFFRASKEESFNVTDESHDLAWIPVDNLPVITRNNISILRMAEKVRNLLGTN